MASPGAAFPTHQSDQSTIQRSDQAPTGGVRTRLAVLWRGAERTTRPRNLAATAAFVLGGLLLLWSAYIHFHLWGETDGYRSIPTIGVLFLLQSIGGVGLGLVVIAIRRVWAALAGIAFALATIGGFLITVTYGLFGFTDSWLVPFAQQAFAIEVTAAAVLVLAVVLCLSGSPRAEASAR
jgi:hypothetical protein